MYIVISGDREIRTATAPDMESAVQLLQDAVVRGDYCPVLAKIIPYTVSVTVDLATMDPIAATSG